MNITPDIVITAVATVASAAVAGGFAWLSSRGGKELSNTAEKLRALESRHARVLQQVESYHVLEGLYAAELEMLSSGKDKALRVKSEFRNRVETANFVRPTMTAHEARAAINELMPAISTSS